MTLIEVRGLNKSFRNGKIEYHALKDVNISIEKGELTAIVGPSGSGKSTLLNMITGIDRPTSGSVSVEGRRIDNMKEDELARWRGDNIGMVFQFFQLFPTLTSIENAMLPMDLARKHPSSKRYDIARKNLETVGLGNKLDSLPSELSGGEQQRVAIARALANDPKIIIGDEPTGNLDSRSESKMFDLLKDLNSKGKTIVFVTHSRDLASRARRKITFLDGRVV